MKPNLDDMLVFLQVVEARTFTKAAEQLGRTKSAISQAVTRLEDDIGQRLLYRSTRSLSLTEAGAQFYAHCCDIKRSYDAALVDIKESVEPSGTLSVTAPHALCEPIVLPAISELIEQHPHMNVRLLADDAPVDLIGSQVDLAIRVGGLDMQAAKAAKLGVLHESLYTSPNYLAARGGLPEDLARLSQWDHIANSWQGSPIKYALGKVVVRAMPRIRSNELHNIVRFAELGLGVARLPDIAVSHSVAKGELVKLVEVSSSPVHYVHLFSKSPPAKVKTFIGLIRNRL